MGYFQIDGYRLEVIGTRVEFKNPEFCLKETKRDPRDITPEHPFENKKG